MNLDTVLRRFPLRATLNDESMVVIRPLATDDKAELRNFFLRVPEEDRYYLNNNVTAPEVIREFTDRINMERVVPLVAEHDGRISLTRPSIVLEGRGVGILASFGLLLTPIFEARVWGQG